MKTILFCFLIVITSITYAQNTIQFIDLYGDYLGQTPPGDTAVVFAPGIISTDYTEHCTPEFSIDGNEVFWWVCMVPGSDNKLTNPGMTMKRIHGLSQLTWARPLIPKKMNDMQD